MRIVKQMKNTAIYLHVLPLFRNHSNNAVFWERGRAKCRPKMTKDTMDGHVMAEGEASPFLFRDLYLNDDIKFLIIHQNTIQFIPIKHLTARSIPVFF